jgi:hypothetical protein
MRSEKHQIAYINSDIVSLARKGGKSDDVVELEFYAPCFHSVRGSMERGVESEGGKSNVASKERIREGMELFYGTIIENYKQSQRAVMTESKVSAIFKKADYKTRMEEFSKVKKAASMLKMESEPGNTLMEEDLLENLQVAKARLMELCESQIQLQKILQAKATRERKVSIKEYTRAMEAVREGHERMQRSLHQLDIIYSDWLEEC